MKITRLELINFKRFTDLTIDQIPGDAKLVLLIGSNGSGKSSVFDAFEILNSASKIGSLEVPSDYYKKSGSQDWLIKKYSERGFETLSSNWFAPSTRKPFAYYGRTSFRQIPRLTRKSLGESNFKLETDSDRPRSFIDRDNRFENDIEKITETILKEFFREKNSNQQIADKYITPINTALDNIFGGKNGTALRLIEIIPPLEGKVAQVTFRKGVSEIHYDFLSAGEKEVINILFNLLSRRPLYQDTLYFFDEIDLHLNTSLQYNFLKEITENWIPENCQLWTASHSLGFIEYARQSEMAATIDLNDLNFDLPQVLTPVPKENTDVYSIAVGKEYLPSLFANFDIYFVENKDQQYYSTINVPNAVFVSDNNRNNVYHKVKASQYKGVVDRDFLSDEDIELIKQHYPNLRILNYYSIENYMYHPHNLEEYYASKQQPYNKVEYIEQLTEAKNACKDSILPSLSLKRTEYPYFGEPNLNDSPLQNRFKNKAENNTQAITIAGYLNSDELETYYKVLPMKSYCTQLPQRKNIAKSELVKTQWFKTKIQEVLGIG